jgi:Tol biopolymer transport system component
VAAVTGIARRRNPWIPAFAAAVVLAAVAGVALLRTPRAPAARAVRFTVPIPPGAVYQARLETSRGFTVSPDGTRLGIEAIAGGRRRIFLRPLDSDAAAELEGSIDATAHFWSPDGRYIAFFANGKLKKVPVTGGPAVDLCDAVFATVGTWGEDGTILFARLDPPGIYRVSAAGGETSLVTSPEGPAGKGNHLWPFFLDGSRFLYMTNERSGLGRRDIRVASLDGRDTTVVAPLKSRVEYAPPGYLFYLRDASLFVQPFDARRAQLRGEPYELASAVHHHYGPGHAAFSVSRTGVLAYQKAPGLSRLVWLDRQGRESGSLGEPAAIKGLRISPDGGRAAVDIGDPRTGTSDVWVFDVVSGVPTRLHSDSVDEIMPVWAPDGSRLFYRSDREGPPDIYEIHVTTPGSEKPLLRLPGIEQPEDVSADGTTLAYLEMVSNTAWNIQFLNLTGDPKPQIWLPTRFDQASPRFSPDGRWIAFESDESGSPEVYVAAVRGAEDKRRISPAGGRAPRWKRDGRELYYVAPGNVLMSASVASGPAWAATAAAVLYRADSEIENYDVSPDGSRFLVCTPVEKVRESPLRVILNWPALLQQKP